MIYNLKMILFSSKMCPRLYGDSGELPTRHCNAQQDTFTLLQTITSFKALESSPVTARGFLDEHLGHYCQN
jgi:hypothetical protein